MRENIVDVERACQNNTRRKDGAYNAMAWFVTGTGIHVYRERFGTVNPLLERDAPSLIHYFRERIGERVAVFRDEPVPLDKFIGFNMIRHCVRDRHAFDSPTTGTFDTPRRELVAAVGVVATDVLAQAIRVKPKVGATKVFDERGIATVAELDSSGRPIREAKLVQLAAVRGSETPRMAFPSLDVTGGRTLDPYIAATVPSDYEHFLETFITPDEISE